MLRSMRFRRTVTSAAVAVLYGASADAGQVNDGDTFSGNKYFVDSSIGLDSYDGLASTVGGGHGPFQTYSGVYSKTGNSSPGPAGSGFLFNRGQVFTPFWNKIENFSNGNYTFGAYGTGPRPILRAVNGTTLGNYLFSPNKAGTSFSIKNLELDGAGARTNASVSMFGVFVSGSCNLTVQHTSIHDTTDGGIELGGSTYPILIDDVSVVGCISGGGNGAGIGGHGGTSLTLRNSTIKNNGTAGATQNHQVYLHGDSTNALTASVTGNLMQMDVDSGNYALVIHGIAQNCNVVGNRVVNTSNGFSASSGYATAESFSNMYYAKNKLSGMGTIGTVAQGSAFDAQCCLNSTWELNVAWNFSLRAHSFGQGDPSNANFTGDAVNTNCTSRHNCFVGNTGAFSGQHGIGGVPAGGSTMSGIKIHNEIITSMKSSGALLIKPAGMPNTGIEVRNCIFWLYGGAGATDQVISWDGTLYSVSAFASYVATFNANPSNASNQIVFTGNIQADPQLKDSNGTIISSSSPANTEPVGLLSGSPCINAGYNTGATTDINGVAYTATTPSIGPWARSY